MALYVHFVDSTYSKFYAFFENSVDPVSWLHQKPADQDLHGFNPHNKSILIMKLHNWIDWKSEVHIHV